MRHFVVGLVVLLLSDTLFAQGKPAANRLQSEATATTNQIDRDLPAQVIFVFVDGGNLSSHREGAMAEAAKAIHNLPDGTKFGILGVADDGTVNGRMAVAYNEQSDRVRRMLDDAGIWKSWDSVRAIGLAGRASPKSIWLITDGHRAFAPDFMSAIEYIRKHHPDTTICTTTAFGAEKSDFPKLLQVAADTGGVCVDENGLLLPLPSPSPQHDILNGGHQTPHVPTIQKLDPSTSPSIFDITSDPTTTYLSLLQQLPKDLYPNAQDGWDEFSLPKARIWTDQNLLGRAVRQSASVDTIQLTRFHPEGNLNETIRWDAEVTLAFQKASIGGIDAIVWLKGMQDEIADETQRANYFKNTWMPNSITISGDEAMARQFKSVRQGDQVVVDGIIRRVDIERALDPQDKRGMIKIILSSCRVTPK